MEVGGDARPASPIFALDNRAACAPLLSAPRLMPSTKRVQAAYKPAREAFAALGVDTDAAMRQLAQIPISLHCWQGDDVGGFENAGGELGGGLAVTGNYPGKARTPDELRQDLEKAYSLLPGNHRLSLHASYAETDGQRIERNELTP